ncbi:hypothetical protein [Luteimonas sp. 3794]|nr:hypothetical protein [Luteimonas sp. 3794]MDR6992877.1 hypothetical protein [Luteimonas sp. 3794]
MSDPKPEARDPLSPVGPGAPLDVAFGTSRRMMTGAPAMCRRNR